MRDDAQRLAAENQSGKPRRPCDAITITSQLRASASFRMASAGNSLGTCTDVQMTWTLAASALAFARMVSAASSVPRRLP